MRRKGQTLVAIVIIIAVISAIFAHSIVNILVRKGAEQILTFEKEQALYLAEMGVNEMLNYMNIGVIYSEGQCIPEGDDFKTIEVPGYDCGYRTCVSEVSVPAVLITNEGIITYYEYTVSSTGRIAPEKSNVDEFVFRTISARIKGALVSSVPISVYEPFHCTLFSEGSS